MFPNVGWFEMMMLMGVAVLLFGKRLPEVGRSLGKGIVEFKKGLSGAVDEFDISGTGRSSWTSGSSAHAHREARCRFDLHRRIGPQVRAARDCLVRACSSAGDGVSSGTARLTTTRGTSLAEMPSTALAQGLCPAGQARGLASLCCFLAGPIGLGLDQERRNRHAAAGPPGRVPRTGHSRRRPFA